VDPADAADLRYTFDAGLDGSVRAESGDLALAVVTQHGGRLESIEHDGGRAVRFAAPCTAVPKECPRAILESGPAANLNPGTSDLQYGATVRISPGQEVDGANVVQKGYSGEGSQFKLQVDHGKPSCVVVDVTRKEIHRAESRSTIGDGVWHRLGCERTGGSLTLFVDGDEAARIAVPADLSIMNSEPLRVGGKGVGPNNDQFSGDVDDVYLSIG